MVGEYGREMHVVIYYLDQHYGKVYLADKVASIEIKNILGNQAL